MGNLKTAHVRLCERPSVPLHISEMAEWILLIFYSWIAHISQVVPVFSDFEKNENWRFYDRFSENFLPRFKIVQTCLEIVLIDGKLDSCKTLQQTDQHSRDDL